MRKTTSKTLSLILVTMMLLLTFAPITSAVNSEYANTVAKNSGGDRVTSSKDPGDSFVGYWTNRSYLPMLVIYDPYGDGSFQQVTTETTISTSCNFEVSGGVYVAGSMGYTCTLFTSYGSSQSTDPNDMGPGKGDRIVGAIYDITWEIWQKPDGSYYLRYYGSNRIGNFLLSRSDLEDLNALNPGCKTFVEDKTGQGGNVNTYWMISANSTPVVTSETYTWNGHLSVGFDLVIHVGWFISADFEVKYYWDFSQENSFTIESHYADTQNMLKFFVSTDQGQANGNDLSDVYSYVHWFSPSDYIPPAVSSPPDVTGYVQGTRGQSINWSIGDQHPSAYKIDQMFQGQITTVVPMTTWFMNRSIAYPFYLLQVGMYTFTLTAYDMELNHASDSVNVTVIPDTTPPTINSPSDIIYNINTTGHNITWTPRDDEPVRYLIFMNGIVQQNLTWDGGDIPPVLVDGLAVGTYTYKCTVIDVGNNMKSDEVLVTVVDFAISVNPTSTTFTPGATSYATVAVTSLGGFSSQVSLSVSTSSASVTASLQTTSGTPTFTSLLTVTTTSTCPSGIYTVTITGTGGGLTRNCTYTLTVSDFAISVNPTSGEFGPATVSLTPLYGFSSSVTLSLSAWGVSGSTVTYYCYKVLVDGGRYISYYWTTTYHGPWYGGWGVTYNLIGSVSISLSQTSGTPPFTSQLTVYTTGSFPTTTWTITITGTGAGRTHSCYYIITVY